jgi:hypothetical protein
MVVIGPASEEGAAGLNRPPVISRAPSTASAAALVALVASCHIPLAQFSGFRLTDGRRNGLLGGSFAARISVAKVRALAVVAQSRDHVHRRNPVRDAVMNFHQHRPAAIGQSLDEPAFPQGALAIEAPFHDVGGKPEQCLVITGMR